MHHPRKPRALVTALVAITLVAGCSASPKLTTPVWEPGQNPCIGINDRPADGNNMVAYMTLIPTLEGNRWDESHYRLGVDGSRKEDHSIVLTGNGAESNPQSNTAVWTYRNGNVKPLGIVYAYAGPDGQRHEVSQTTVFESHLEVPEGAHLVQSPIATVIVCVKLA
jgi:hypothetical protein